MCSNAETLIQVVFIQFAISIAMHIYIFIYLQTTILKNHEIFDKLT